MTTTSETAPAPRAVLADDERLMRDLLRARLAEVWPELQVVAEARNGLEAVQHVQSHRPDVVFLDICMPGLSGVEVARQIAQLPDGEDDDTLSSLTRSASGRPTARPWSAWTRLPACSVTCAGGRSSASRGTRRSLR